MSCLDEHKIDFGDAPCVFPGKYNTMLDALCDQLAARQQIYAGSDLAGHNFATQFPVADEHDSVVENGILNLDADASSNDEIAGVSHPEIYNDRQLAAGVSPWILTNKATVTWTNNTTIDYTVQARRSLKQLKCQEHDTDRYMNIKIVDEVLIDAVSVNNTNMLKDVINNGTAHFDFDFTDRQDVKYHSMSGERISVHNVAPGESITIEAELAVESLYTKKYQFERPEVMVSYLTMPGQLTFA